jgi:hypothetical protein
MRSVRRSGEIFCTAICASPELQLRQFSSRYGKRGGNYLFAPSLPGPPPPIRLLCRHLSPDVRGPNELGTMDIRSGWPSCLVLLTGVLIRLRRSGTVGARPQLFLIPAAGDLRSPDARVVAGAGKTASAGSRSLFVNRGLSHARLPEHAPRSRGRCTRGRIAAVGREPSRHLHRIRRTRHCDGSR